jgi:hypothetical protein
MKIVVGSLIATVVLAVAPLKAEEPFGLSQAQSAISIASRYRNPADMFKAEFRQSNTFKIQGYWHNSGSKQVVWFTPLALAASSAARAKLQMREITPDEIRDKIKPDIYKAVLQIHVQGASAGAKMIRKKFLSADTTLLLKIGDEVVRPIQQADAGATVDQGPGIYQERRIGKSNMATVSKPGRCIRRGLLSAGVRL